MRRRIALRIACVVSPLVAAVATAGRAAIDPASVQSTTVSSSQGFVGAAKCAECHAAVHQTWSSARHSKMLQPATPATVLGDFSQSSVTLRGL